MNRFHIEEIYLLSSNTLTPWRVWCTIVDLPKNYSWWKFYFFCSFLVKKFPLASFVFWVEAFEYGHLFLDLCWKLSLRWKFTILVAKLKMWHPISGGWCSNEGIFCKVKRRIWTYDNVNWFLHLRLDCS